MKALQADAAASTTPEVVTPAKAAQVPTKIDELAALKCEGASVKYAPSKRSCLAVWGGTRTSAFFPIRRRACFLGHKREAIATESEIAHQFEQASHWASFGDQIEARPDVARKRPRRVARTVRVSSSQSDADSASVSRASSDSDDAVVGE